MKIAGAGTHFRVTELAELTAANVPAVREQLLKALPPWANGLDLELADTARVDAAGLELLRALQRELTARGVVVRITAVSPALQPVLDRTDLALLPPIVP